MSNNKKIIFLSILLGLWICVSVAMAAEEFKLKYDFPCSGLPGTTCPEETATSPAAYIARFYQFALAIAGMLAFGMIIFGAIQYTVSSGNVGKQSDARDRIFQALWGIALILGAYLILYTIDPKLVSLRDPGIEKIVAPTTAPTTPTTWKEPTQYSWVSELNMIIKVGNIKECPGSYAKPYNPIDNQKEYSLCEKSGPKPKELLPAQYYCCGK